MRKDIYQHITNKIIEHLESVTAQEFQAPFASLAAQGMPSNPVTGNTYHGINIPKLWCDQQIKEFSSNEWATFKQWKQVGASVRKGEKASQIVFFKSLVKEAENETGGIDKITIPCLKTYAVFNASQVDGYNVRTAPDSKYVDLVQRNAEIDQFCGETGADIRLSQQGAYYHKDDDYIAIPDTIRFDDSVHADATENYYSVLFHELAHWTGAKHRLDRDKAQSTAELDKYAFEELVAELGAAFLCGQFAVGQKVRKSHAIYIKSWLTALKNEPKFIFKASAQAAKAIEFLNMEKPK